MPQAKGQNTLLQKRDRSKNDLSLDNYSSNNPTINKKNSPWEIFSHPPSGGVRPSRVEQNCASSTGVTGALGRNLPPDAAIAPVSTANAAAAA